MEKFFIFIKPVRADADLGRKSHLESSVSLIVSVHEFPSVFWVPPRELVLPTCKMVVKISGSPACMNLRSMKMEHDALLQQEFNCMPHK